MIIMSHTELHLWKRNTKIIRYVINITINLSIIWIFKQIVVYTARCIGNVNILFMLIILNLLGVLKLSATAPTGGNVVFEDYSSENISYQFGEVN